MTNDATMARQNSRHISLNVNLAVPQTTLQLPDGSHTPNTPEILNSIVSMQTTPFSGFQQPIAPGNINKDYAEVGKSHNPIFAFILTS